LPAPRSGRSLATVKAKTADWSIMKIADEVIE
jgi:hypothetical protein